MMKRKTYLNAIMFVIAGLLITSVSGMMSTQMMAEEENTNTSFTENMNIPQSLRTIHTGQFERHTVSMPSQLATARIYEPTRSDSIAIHPALGTEPWVDGYSERAVLGYLYYYYDPDTGASFGPTVLWHVTNDNCQTWGGEWYFYDPLGNPLDWDYPSLHFRGYNSSSGETMFSGSARDGTNGGTNGGATHTILIEGDPILNTSWTAFSWPWHNHGWFGAVMAENAPALLPGYEWAWGFNSHVMSTTYTYPGMTATDYQTDGCFINYQTSADGYGTISWYNEFGGCLSADAIIDPVSTWEVNGTVIPYAGYAVYDPSTFNGTTTFTHYLAIRAFDWEALSPLDNYSGTYDVMYWFEPDANYSMEHPAIAAYGGNIIVMVERVNMSDLNDVDVLIYHTDDGDISHLELVKVISADDPVTPVLSPEVSWVDGETFLAHVTTDNTIYVLASHDGGANWSDLVQWSDDEEEVVEEYRNCDISDEGRMSIWESDNSTASDLHILLHYVFNTCNYRGDAVYEYGDPAPLSVATITNENTSTLLPANIEWNTFQRDLIYTFDIWDTSIMTIYVEDISTPACYGEITIQGEVDYVETFHIWMCCIIPPPQVEVYITSGFGVTTCLLGYSDITSFTVRVTDPDGDPIQGVPAEEFDFFAYLGPDVGTCCDLNSHLEYTAIDPQTDANGEIRFTVKALTSISANIPAPTWSGGYITLEVDWNGYSDDVDIYVNSPDIDHNCWVNLMDFSTFAVDFGQNAQRSDYNWNGRADLSDFSIFAVHFGHRQICP